jgi:hypothetical protein
LIREKKPRKPIEKQEKPFGRFSFKKLKLSEPVQLNLNQLYKITIGSRNPSAPSLSPLAHLPSTLRVSPVENLLPQYASPVSIISLFSILLPHSSACAFCFSASAIFGSTILV